jgi:membrane protease YdiL (CAAX protease family)
MTEELDVPAIIATLVILAVLGSSAFLWIQRIQAPRLSLMPDAGAPSWPIGWVNFGIFICATIFAVVLVQNFGFLFLADTLDANDGELTPWLAVGAVLLLQIPLLAVFYCARRFFPGQYASRLNTSNFSLGAALRYAAPFFLRFLPIIWIVTFFWTQILSILQALGLIDEFEPQELITLFQAGGDPVAIGLLILFAVVLAPLVEELIFRGCIYRFFKSKMTYLPAQGISAVIFASMHGNLLSFVPLILVGVLLARVYEKSGSILVSICFHGFFNAFSLLMLFIMSHSDVLPQ